MAAVMHARKKWRMTCLQTCGSAVSNWSKGGVQIKWYTWALKKEQGCCCRPPAVQLEGDNSTPFALLLPCIASRHCPPVQALL